MRKGLFFGVFLFVSTVVWSRVSLEDVARQYLLHLRYDWNLGYAELRSESTNRTCRVYFYMPYIVVDSKIYYFEQAPTWETNGRMLLSPEMEVVVTRFAQEVQEGKTNRVNIPSTSLTNKVSILPDRGGGTNVFTNQQFSSPTQIVSLQTNTNRTHSSVSVTVTNTKVTNQQPISPKEKSTISGERDLFRPIRTIILDPGHGGKDPGGIGKGGVMEKALVLQFSDILREKFEKMGYRVVVTRLSDTYVSLSDRIEIAYRKWSANEGALFLSIHGNISLNPRVQGIEVYYLSDKASDAAASAVEIAENAGFSMDDVKHTENFYSVLNVLMREGVSRVSRVLAQEIKTSLSSRSLRVSVKSANFYVLRFSPLPAILWEVGYLSHAEEVRLLQSSSYQQKLSEAFVKGVDRFIRRYNERRGNV